MEYWHNKPNGDKFVIEFYHHKYPDLFERSFSDNSYFLTQDVKSWLVKNDIKVFVTHTLEDQYTKFSIKFQSPTDAKEFMDEYALWGEQQVRLRDMK